MVSYYVETTTNELVMPVLILIVVEDGLVLELFMAVKASKKRLNPYSLVSTK